jgi:hypothetical protein
MAGPPYRETPWLKVASQRENAKANANPNALRHREIAVVLANAHNQRMLTRLIHWLIFLSAVAQLVALLLGQSYMPSVGF